MDRPRRRLQSAKVAGAIVGAIGIVLSLIHVTHPFVHDKPPVATVIGAILPLALSLVVVYAGYWTVRQDALGDYVDRLVYWALLGGVAMGAIVGSIALHQYLAGHLPDDAVFQLATAVTGGVLGGVLVGRYDAQLRRRSNRIRGLQEATSELLAADQKATVCDRVVAIAREELSLPLTAAWLYDETDEVLEPVAATEEGLAVVGEHPTFEPGESLSWTVFEEGEPRVYPDLREQPERHNPETVVRSEMILPIGDHGVLNVGSPEPDAFDEIDISTARLLADATAAVLDRVDREQQLRERQQELTAANERLEEFASIVSHDLRNPLGIAQGNLELARDDCDSPALDRVEVAHRRMDALVGDLLELARSGRTIDETEPVPLAAAATDAWNMVETDDTTIELDLSDGASDSGADPESVDDRASVEADRDRLVQLFENLFRNAIEHGGTAVRVGRLEDDRGFYVEDDGPGIPPDRRDRVFESGYTTNEEGTGLGLAVVESVADAHGWLIEVDDGKVGGARFEFRT